MLATDSPYFQHFPTPDAEGFYKAAMETEADVAGGDKDFDDAYVYTKPATKRGEMAEVYAVKAGTGRRLDLHDSRGRILAANFSTTPRFKQPVLWGSYAMNLSAAIPGAKSRHILYLDYTDWAAVVESKLGVNSRVDGRRRGDGPGRKEWVAPRHNGRANVAFLDTHVERLLPTTKGLLPPADENEPSLWHPRRPVGWTPPQLPVN
jgi:prepilin-type processing-associated H-X9-DG protein